MTKMLPTDFKSNEEQLFYSLICDIEKKGYIKDITYETQSIVLSDAVKYQKSIELKTKTKFVEKTLIHGHHYTPDFEIIWNENAWDVFVNNNNDKPFYGVRKDDTIKSVIEIKGMFDRSNMTRLFTLNQKWVMSKTGIYVQLIKMPKFLEKVYTPDSIDMVYKKGPKKGKGKINIIQFSEFINNK